ncbi:MAG TPA: hypothetical protein VJO35_09085 [Terriglobales bacterium]|nr:hypothetical protein [Terriglobales bacterium]
MAERNLAVPITSEAPNGEETGSGWSVSEEVHELGGGGYVNHPSEGLAENARLRIERGVSAARRSLEAGQEDLTPAARTVLGNLRQFVNERPIHFLGFVACAAFTAGVALRIWRSRHD